MFIVFTWIVTWYCRFVKRLFALSDRAFNTTTVYIMKHLSVSLSIYSVESWTRPKQVAKVIKPKDYVCKTISGEFSDRELATSIKSHCSQSQLW